jgi:hypothetical protein
METPRKHELVMTREIRPQRGCEGKLNDRGNAGGDYVSLRCAISASLAKPQILLTAAN